MLPHFDQYVFICVYLRLISETTKTIRTRHIKNKATYADEK